MVINGQLVGKSTSNQYQLITILTNLILSIINH